MHPAYQNIFKKLKMKISARTQAVRAKHAAMPRPSTQENSNAEPPESNNPSEADSETSPETNQEA